MGGGGTGEFNFLSLARTWVLFLPLVSAAPYGFIEGVHGYLEELSYLEFSSSCSSLHFRTTFKTSPGQFPKYSLPPVIHDFVEQAGIGSLFWSCDVSREEHTGSLLSWNLYIHVLRVHFPLLILLRNYLFSSYFGLVIPFLPLGIESRDDIQNT